MCYSIVSSSKFVICEKQPEANSMCDVTCVGETGVREKSKRLERAVRLCRLWVRCALFKFIGSPSLALKDF